MGRLDVFRRAELERRGDEIYTASFISPMDTRRYIADACVFGGEAAFPGMPCFHSFFPPPPPFFFLFSAAPSVVFESQQRRNSLLSVCSLGGRAVRCFVSGRCSAMRALLFAREALFRGIISRAQARALPAHEKYTFAAEPRDRLAGLCGLCIFRFYRVENFAGRPS